MSEIPKELMVAFAQLGVAGVMLYWFMTKHAESMKENAAKIEEHGRKVDKLEQRFHKMINATLLEVLTRDNVAPNIKAQAQRLIEENES